MSHLTATALKTVNYLSQWQLSKNVGIGAAPQGASVKPDNLRFWLVKSLLFHFFILLPFVVNKDVISDYSQL